MALALVALALLLRVLQPAGFMPSAEKRFAITICTGMGAVPAWIDAKGQVRKDAPGQERGPDHPCAFAGLAAGVTVPDLVTPLGLLGAAGGVTLIGTVTAVAIGRGLAAPPPPPTGPPAHP